jgi:hypothetical protein
MALLPYFKWYVADAENDEKYSAMDDAELGLYHRCMNKSWSNGGIPADPEERARLFRLPREIADERWKRVGKCFVPSATDPKRLVNPRQEIERADAISKSLKAKTSRLSRAKGQASTPPMPSVIPAVMPAGDSVDDDKLQEISLAFDRHMKYGKNQTKDLVIQMVLSMNGKFDWSAFRIRHTTYCQHWDQNGWQYSNLSFLEWIQAGMPPPPTSKAKVGQSTSTRFEE